MTITSKFNLTVFIFSILLFTNTNNIQAQVPLKTVVEHFTNTNCSVCASRNPGFYTNLNGFPAVNYLSVHPSSPYASCLLSQQNTVGNDARTNFYNIYGGTPRLVINGAVISAATNYGNSTLFSSTAALTSDYSITIYSATYFDSITNTVVIKKHSNTMAPSNVTLFLGAIEDTITYTGGNGEPKHYNALRKTILNNTAVTLPANIGDSVSFTGLVLKNAVWNWDRMKVIAILADGNKSVLQSQIQIPTIGIVTPLSIQDSENSDSDYSTTNSIEIYPNPTQGNFYIKSAFEKDITAELVSVLGVSKTITIKSKQLTEINDLPKGIYFLKSNRHNGFSRKVIVQ